MVTCAYAYLLGYKVTLVIYGYKLLHMFIHDYSGYSWLHMVTVVTHGYRLHMWRGYMFTLVIFTLVMYGYSRLITCGYAIDLVTWLHWLQVVTQGYRCS